MTLTRNLLSDAVRYGLSAGAIGLLGLAAIPAFAQTTPTTTPTPEKKAKDLERIEVVGSRIPRAVDYESTSPVTTITRADIEQSGVTTTFDLLSRITASDGSGLSTVTTQTNGSDGTETISLRNLGPQRTLILVDGKRWPTDINGIVDVSTIPIAIIERVDVLKDGASAIYGSDAVAGVINFITRRKYEGAQVGWYYGQTSHGDGSKSVVDATIGASSERSSAVVSISRTEQKSIFAGDRERSNASVFGCNRVLSNRHPGFPDNSDPNNLGGLCGSTFGQFGRFFGAGLPGAGVALDNSFHDSHNASGDPRDATVTAPGGGRFASDFVTWNPLDRYNFAPVNYLQQPSIRNNIFLSGRFDITDNVSAFARVNYNQRQSSQQLAQVPTSLSSSGGFGPQWAFGVSQNNVFNPFGTQITTAFFRNVAVGPRHNSYDFNTIGSTAGLEGSFTIGDRAFNWDIYGQYNSQRNTKIGSNYINLFNLRSALGPSFRDLPTIPGTLGALHCGTPGNVIANCVPFNLFGGPDLGLGHGIITAAEYAAMINYVSYTEVQENANKGTNFGANISGEIVPLQGGMLSFAAGIETRRDRALFQPDTLVASGGSSDNFTEPSRGQTKIDEAYVELSAPLLKDLPFAKELEIDVAARKSRYSANGFVGTTHVTSNPGNPTDAKYTLRWKPYSDLLLRASYGETFRAPSVNDLFAGGSENFPVAQDPCNNNQILGLSPAGQALCHAQGVPANGVVQQNVQIRALAGGNKDLGPEKGKNLTLGFVYSPSYVSGLNLTVDYWRIKLKDALAAFTSQTILNNCYAVITPNPADQFCTKVDRLPNGQIVAVRTAQFNAASQLVDGVDVGFNYKRDTNWGAFGLKWDTTYNNREQFNGVEFLGTYNGAPNWRVRSLATLSWEKGDFDASWTARYNSSMVENGGCNRVDATTFNLNGTVKHQGTDLPQLRSLICNHPNETSTHPGLFPGLGFNRIGAVVYNDVQIGWKAPWKAKLTVGARNVFGKEPPYTKNSFASSFDASYDLPGGPFYYFQYRQDF